ncbi:MAG: sulfatase-like hydrolase/transferase [Planctomycetes bacterium]|nr:sulfatase-like hydrolase/transferase [Planctomycetota bacterium]
MNVILILADQLSAKWMGCYGNPAASTPNLDAMAERGTLFERCVSNLPVCMPARASIMTGRSAQHHGVFYNGWELGLGLPTFPQILQKSGVQTFGVGKFHLECHGRSAYNDVLKYGFDKAQTTEDIRAGEWLDWVEQAYPEHYERALATCWAMPHLEDYGPSHRNLREEILDAKRKYSPDVQAELTYPSIVPEEACQTQWIGNEAVSTIEGRDPSRPFFLKVSFVDPHDPYDPPERYLDRIDVDKIPPCVRSDDPALHSAVERFGNLPFLQRFGPLNEEDWRIRRRYYLASLAFIDDQVGRIVDAVRTSGIEEDTLILFTADHGDMVGDHGFAAKGGWHFDACYRIPLLVAGPGVQAKREGHVVSLLDLFPTITDYAGVDHGTPVEGRSLRPVLEGDGDLNRPNAALVESYGSYGDESVPLQAKTVITPDANFTLFGDNTGMLFDLNNDPDECVNLFGRPEAAGMEREMRDILCDLLIRQNQPMPLSQRHPTARH